MGSRLLGRIVQLEPPLVCAARNAAARAVPVRVQLRQLEPVGDLTCFGGAWC